MRPPIKAILLALLPSLTQSYEGKMTWYSPNGGYGSCGAPSANSDFVVALAPSRMNGACFSHIGIYNPRTGVASDATIVDTCGRCGDNDIDVSSGLFNYLAGEGSGIQNNVGWGGEVVGN